MFQIESSLRLALPCQIHLCNEYLSARFKEGGLEIIFFLSSFDTLVLHGLIGVPKVFLHIKQRQLSVQPCPLPKHGHFVFL